MSLRPAAVCAGVLGCVLCVPRLAPPRSHPAPPRLPLGPTLRRGGAAHQPPADAPGAHPWQRHAWWQGRRAAPRLARPLRQHRATQVGQGGGCRVAACSMVPACLMPRAAGCPLLFTHRLSAPLLPPKTPCRARSPWQLLADSPASQRRGSVSGTPASQPRRSPLALASPAAASLAAGAAGRWQQLQQQLLQRCQGEGGGIRITAAKARARPAAAAAPSPPAKPAAPAPAPVPELPPFSLAGAAKPAAPAAPAAKAAAAPAAAPTFGAAAPAGGLFGAAASAPDFGAASAPAFGAAASAPAFGGLSFGSAPASTSAAAGERWSLLATAARAAAAAAAAAALFLAWLHQPPAHPLVWPPLSANTPGDGAFFLPAARFEGAKPGYVFKMDGSGLGYYRDQQLPTAGSLFGAPLLQ